MKDDKQEQKDQELDQELNIEDLDAPEPDVDSDEEFVAVDEEGDEQDSLDKIKELKKKIKELTEEKQQYLTGWQRARADFVNLQKRTEEERSALAKYTNQALIEEILPVLDSFNMAFGNKEVWESVDKNWRVGIEYIHTQLLNILTQHGCSVLNPLNEKFDPNLHHSVGQIKVDSPEKDHIILEVVSPGYSMYDKILKAPTVKIGMYEESN
jgi:molecular chaperone GrpE